MQFSIRDFKKRGGRERRVSERERIRRREKEKNIEGKRKRVPQRRTIFYLFFKYIFCLHFKLNRIQTLSQTEAK